MRAAGPPREGLVGVRVPSRLLRFWPSQAAPLQAQHAHKPVHRSDRAPALARPCRIWPASGRSATATAIRAGCPCLNAQPRPARELNLAPTADVPVRAPPRR